MTAPKHDIFCRDGSNHRGRSHAYASFSSFMTSDKCFAPSVPPAKDRIDKGRKKVLLRSVAISSDWSVARTIGAKMVFRWG